jgi:hypothetical protein
MRGRDRSQVREKLDLGQKEPLSEEEEKNPGSLVLRAGWQALLPLLSLAHDS